MASFSYSDDEDQKRGAQQDKLGAPQAPSGPTPTFAELQRRGMPRPPPMAPGGSQFGGPNIHPRAPDTRTPFIGQRPPQYGAGVVGAPPPGPMMSAMKNPYGPGGLYNPVTGVGGGGMHYLNKDSGAGAPPPTGANPLTPSTPLESKFGAGAHGYQSTGELNQGNLEGYLYDMLANPTATPTYKHAMRQIGADIDTDASRRGVFYSTIPVGSYSEAGSQLAAGLQGRAYDQLRGYNQDYEQLLMALLGAT